MDLRAFAEGGTVSASKEGMAGFGRFTSGEIAVPIVGAANATAVAGGFELLLGCDVVVAAETALFGVPEVKRGLFAAGGGVFISTRIPLAAALELTLTGDLIDAVRAQSLGLINQAVPQAEVLDAAVALAERIAKNGPLALAATKQMVRTASTDLQAGPGAGAGMAAEGLQLGGRQGRGQGVHREARPRVAGPLSHSFRSEGALGSLDRRLEGHRDPGHHDVGAAAQGPGEDQVDLVVQDALAQVVRAHDRDEHHDLVVGVVPPHVVDELHNRLHHRGVVVVHHVEGHAGIPLAPLLAQGVDVAGALVAPLERRR